MCFNVPASRNCLCSILKPFTSTVKSGNSLKASSVLADILMSCMLIFFRMEYVCSNQRFLCTRSQRRGPLCCDIRRLSQQREAYLSVIITKEWSVTLHTLRWPSFEVDIMSLWEMQSVLQDDTSALERRLWLQMHLSAATIPSYSSSSSSLPGEGEQKGDKEEGKRRGERLWSEGQSCVAEVWRANNQQYNPQALTFTIL